MNHGYQGRLLVIPFGLIGSSLLLRALVRRSGSAVVIASGCVAAFALAVSIWLYTFHLTIIGWVGILLLVPTFGLAIVGFLSDDGLLLLSALGSNSNRRRSGSWLWFLLRHGSWSPTVAMNMIAAAGCWVIAFLVAGSMFHRSSGSNKRGLDLLFAVCFVAAKNFYERGLQQLSNGLTPPTDGTFTLLLRSFYDDFTELSVRSWLGVVAGRLTEFVETQKFASLLAGVCWPYGPVLSVGAQEQRDSPGALIRVYASEDSWQTDVERLSASAAHIILAISDTTGLQWEYKHLINANRANVSMLMPPDDPSRRLERWNGMTEGYTDASQDLIIRTLLVRHASDGVPIHVTASAPSKTAYEIALQCAFLPLEQFEATVGYSSKVRFASF